MLSQWIQVAAELRTTLGDLFGFANIMEGLTAHQVSWQKIVYRVVVVCRIGADKIGHYFSWLITYVIIYIVEIADRKTYFS